MGPEQIESIEQAVTDAAERGGPEAARAALQPLLDAQDAVPEAVDSLLRIVRHQLLAPADGLDVLSAIDARHGHEPALLARIGSATEGARDIDDLNAAPPDDPLFASIVSRLSRHAKHARGGDTEERLHDGLATAARMLARQHDDIAEASYRRLVELDPDFDGYHYALGLFCKTRGRFADGMRANQRALELADAEREAYNWNLGICATGAREGAVALDVWKRMGQKLEMGRFGLPDGRYPQCKVRLAQFPLAERDANNDAPGLEETIWIQRLSPCHGIVRSVLYQRLGVDFGDIVLFDGAPITYHTYGDERVPVFPHLATLQRNDYQFYDFAGTQETAGQLQQCSADLEGDAVVYSHSESFQAICSSCWRDPDLDHAAHTATERHVVTGRIAAPPDLAPETLLAQLDAAVARREPCKLLAPGLCAAAGDDHRAAVEQRRYDMLTGA